MKRKTLGILLIYLGWGALACQQASSPLAPQVSLPQSTSSSTTPAPSAATQVREDFPFQRILCFGDSITLGVTSRTASSLPGLATLTPVEGYVPKLGRLLTQEFGEGIELINSGLGAETTSEGLERLDGEILIFDPDLILLLEGVVDVNNESPRFPVVRSNLAEMMRVAQRRRVAIIIGTFPLLNPDGFRTRGAANVPRLNDVIRQEAKKKGVPVADHEKASGDDFKGQGPDGLHPNAIGYQIMAETWFTVIRQLVPGSET